VFIPIIKFYKIYIESNCQYQGFNLIKLISTYNQLNSREYDKVFIKNVPMLELCRKNTDFGKTLIHIMPVMN